MEAKPWCSAGPGEAPSSPLAQPYFLGQPFCQNPVSVPDFGVTDLRAAFTRSFSEAHPALTSTLSLGQDGKL